MQSSAYRLPLSLVSIIASTMHGCGVGEIGSPRGFLSPAQGSTVGGELWLRLGEIPAGSERVTFELNGEIFAEDLVPPYEAWLDTGTLEDGEAMIVAAVADSEQGSLPFAAVRVIVDNLGPTISIRAPTTRSCVPRHGELTIAADVEDEVPIDNVEFRLDGEPVAAFAGAPPYRHTFVPPTDRPTLEIAVAAQNNRGLIANRTVQVPVCDDP